MAAGVGAYFLTGQFWFAEFLALLSALLYTGLFGRSPGQGLGSYATMRLEDWRTWAEFAASFSAASVLANLGVAGTVYLVTLVL